MEEHFSNLRVNSGAPTMLVHSFIKKLLGRKKKSAIINVSSIASNAPLPYMGVYSASKRFLTIFSNSLQDNYGNQIDIQDFTPGYVTTKISNFHKGPDSISPEECVQKSIRDLGQEFTCVPVISHSMNAQIFHTLYRHATPLFQIFIGGFIENLALSQFYREFKKEN